LTQVLGFTAGQALVVEAVLGAHVPFGIPVVVAAQPMHMPGPVAARPQALLQQTPSTHEPLAHSMLAEQLTPGPLAGMQVDPEQ
jgi:hypothetical protein